MFAQQDMFGAHPQMMWLQHDMLGAQTQMMSPQLGMMPHVSTARAIVSAAGIAVAGAAGAVDGTRVDPRSYHHPPEDKLQVGADATAIVFPDDAKASQH